MKKLVILLVMGCTSAFAQVKKEVGNFDKVKTFDRITVELIASNEERVEVYGNRAADVEFVNKNGELKIRMRTGKLLEGDDVDAKVFFKSLKSIDANEGSFVGCDKAFAQDNLYISSQEGAQVNVKLDVAQLTAKSATGGKLKTSGTAKNQEVVIGAGGLYEGKSLESSHAKVDVKAGGKAEVRASDFADARVTAGGLIVIYGNPKEIKRKTTLGGEIEEVRN